MRFPLSNLFPTLLYVALNLLIQLFWPYLICLFCLLVYFTFFYFVYFFYEEYAILHLRVFLPAPYIFLLPAPYIFLPLILYFSKYSNYLWQFWMTQNRRCLRKRCFWNRRCSISKRCFRNTKSGRQKKNSRIFFLYIFFLLL